MNATNQFKWGVFVIFLIISVLILYSCTEQSPADRPNEISSTIVTYDSDTQSEIEEPADNYDPIIDSVKPSNGRISDFYTNNTVPSVNKDTIKEYLNNSYSASNIIQTLYDQSDQVKSVPILGTYLEKSSLYACLFEKSNELIGIKTVSVDNDGKIVSELEALLGNYYSGSPFMDSYCFSVVSHCKASFPDFTILGIVYDESSGFKMVYPVGKIGSGSIMYYDIELRNFDLIESFNSLSEGRTKFNDFWIFRAQLLSQCRIFEWETVPLHPNGWINQFRFQDAYLSGLSTESISYLFDYDWYLVIPLLNAEGNEGDYVLHLLFNKTKLISELVLQNLDGQIQLKYSRISDKDGNSGEYLGLDKADYIEICRQLPEQSVGSIAGIGFDKDHYLVIYNDLNP